MPVLGSTWLSEDRQFEPLFEIAMQKELYQLLFEWLCAESAVEWSRNPQNRTAEGMVQDVLVVVAAGLAPVLS
ncbi:hypothetical protein AB4114_20775 [Paenibacillus sp. 2RAB27]|uniref:hypothetical protein n=1 Tax=Paenibacillus sp. 2RAB27 TaxID=3232991 RepID=UPI003F94CE61